MLKRIITIISSLILCVSFTFVFGCGKQDSTREDQKVVLMNGFEYFDRDVQLIRLFNEFGRLDQNSDAQYVRSGSKSLKLTPLGSRLNTANPFILLPSFSTRFTELAFGDFSKADKLSFWFYNAETESVNVGIGFGKGILQVDPGARRDSIRKTCIEYFSLKSGWNYIEYKVVPSYLALQGLNIKEVYGIVIEFDYVVSHRLADSPEIYLDDVYITYADVEKPTDFSMNVKTGVTDDGKPYWSVSDFEDESESYFYYYNYSFPAPASAHPVIKTVFAGDYGVITEKGTQVLLIQKKHGGEDYGWPGIVISPQVLLEVFAAIGQDLELHPEKYELKFDVFNGSDYTGGWGVEYYPNYTTGTGEIGGIGTYDSVIVAPKSWHYHKWNIGDLNARAQAVKESDPDADVKPFTENPFVRFAWDKFSGERDTADRPFFIDNVRIEKVAD